MRCHTSKVFLLSLIAASLRAQSIAAYSSVGRAETVERATLAGGGIGLGTTFSRGQLNVELRGEVMRGSREHVGSPCSGLIPIEATYCSPRLLRSTTTLESGGVGVGARILHWARMKVSLFATLSIARIGTATRDSLQNESLSARRLMFIPETGVDWRWRPVVRLPVALTAGAKIGYIMPFSRDQIADGYTPFNEALGLRRAWLGVAYAFDR